MKTKIMFMEVAKAITMISSIAKRGPKLDNDIQNVAMSAIYHANTPGDNNADIGIKLVGALSSGSRKASLIVYLCTHGNFGYTDKKLSFERKGSVETDAVKLHEKLSANHWTKAVPEIDPEAVLDAGKQVTNLIKRIQKMVKDGNADKVSFGSTDTFATQVLSIIKGKVVDGAEFDMKVTAE